MISVIIPTYKSPDALDLCLSSAIEGQDKINEIIVIVDGFYDLNKHVLNHWSSKIKIIDFKENKGLCCATNTGVLHASHRNILIVNDDNVFPENWDTHLLKYDTNKSVYSPNQIEPSKSMFPQFIIKDLGRSINDFDINHFNYFNKTISQPHFDISGSTLPIYMSKKDFMAVGGWDANFELGLVADWDFFVKCHLTGYQMRRVYDCHFYHFVSLSTAANKEQEERRHLVEIEGHRYAAQKWGSPIKHDNLTNLKYI